MLLHHPTIVHLSPAAWLKTVWLEVVVERLAVLVAGLVI